MEVEQLKDEKELLEADLCRLIQERIDNFKYATGVSVINTDVRVFEVRTLLDPVKYRVQEVNVKLDI